MKDFFYSSKGRQQPFGLMPKFRALVAKFPNNSSRVSATIMHATMRKSFSVLRKWMSVRFGCGLPV